MKKIRIAYIDFWHDFDAERFLFTRLLRKHFEVEVNTEEPDFIFCSNTGKNYLQYSCPRIYFTGEAVCPDFNVYDYAIGFDRIAFGDRYLYYPLRLLDRTMMERALRKHEWEDSFFKNKSGFCSYVVSADGGVGNRRDDYFDAICKYCKVDSGGRHRNNLPDGKPVPDKLAFQKQYRFSLTCENSAFKGYVTRCYLAMVHEPALKVDSPLHKMMEDDYVEEFLVHIFMQEPGEALRRNSAFSRNGKFHEYYIYKMNKLETNRLLNMLRRWKRCLFGTKKL